MYNGFRRWAMVRAKCGYCEGVIASNPYSENINDQLIYFHAKAWADALKTSKFASWAYCGGLVAYKPYTEDIDGKMRSFHAKSCADSYKEHAIKALN